MTAARRSICWWRRSPAGRKSRSPSQPCAAKPAGISPRPGTGSVPPVSPKRKAIRRAPVFCEAMPGSTAPLRAASTARRPSSKPTSGARGLPTGAPAFAKPACGPKPSADGPASTLRSGNPAFAADLPSAEWAAAAAEDGSADERRGISHQRRLCRGPRLNTPSQPLARVLNELANPLSRLRRRSLGAGRW